MAPSNRLKARKAKKSEKRRCQVYPKGQLLAEHRAGWVAVFGPEKRPMCSAPQVRDGFPLLLLLLAPRKSRKIILFVQLPEVEDWSSCPNPGNPSPASAHRSPILLGLDLRPGSVAGQNPHPRTGFRCPPKGPGASDSL